MTSLLLELVRWAVIACAAYLTLTLGLYFAILLASAADAVLRQRQRRAEDVGLLALSRFTIPVSVVVAAYDEEPIIAASVRSLLELDYPEYEVIVVNDGSGDGTLDVLRREFSLEARETFYRRVFETEEIRGIYRSRLDPRLVVVDKANGGKADALNAGVNLARYRYVCGVDADTILAPDALLRTMPPAVRDPGAVVAVTSHVAVGLEPERAVVDGRRRLDRSLLSNFQQLDYLRAFLASRLGWSRLGFMLCTVGAFHLWRRDVLEELGGFSRAFTCEDIELTFRAHERFLSEGRPYRILCLPDTVGTTEAPRDVRRLVSQRERWQRVIMETVVAYRGMLGRPRYRAAGLVGLPFYLVSEVVAPFFEALSLLTFVVAAALGVLDWTTLALVLGLVAFANGILASAALLVDDVKERSYRLRDLARLVALAPLELVLYRPVLVWARLKGAWRFLRGDRGWHKFARNERAQVRTAGAGGAAADPALEA